MSWSCLQTHCKGLLVCSKIVTALLLTYYSPVMKASWEAIIVHIIKPFKMSSMLLKAILVCDEQLNTAYKC